MQLLLGQRLMLAATTTISSLRMYTRTGTTVAQIAQDQAGGGYVLVSHVYPCAKTATDSLHTFLELASAALRTQRPGRHIADCCLLAYSTEHLFFQFHYRRSRR